MRCQTSGRSCTASIFQPSPDPLHQKAAVKAGMFLFGVDTEFVSSNLLRIEELLSLVGSQGTVGKPVARPFFSVLPNRQQAGQDLGIPEPALSTYCSVIFDFCQLTAGHIPKPIFAKWPLIPLVRQENSTHSKSAVQPIFF